MCNRPLYTVCEFVLESNVPLPELPQADGKKPECTFQLLPAHDAKLISAQWFHQWHTPDGEPWLSFARLASGYLLRFPDLADFLVSADVKAIRCYPVPGTPLETIKHLFLDQVLPLVLSKRGKLIIHASAIVAQEGAIAFVGMTGQGKSTLATSFSMHGFPLMTDDSLLLEVKEGRLIGTPIYPGVRLWDDSISVLFEHEPVLSEVAHYTDKKRLAANNDRLLFCRDSVPIQRLYFLAPLKEVATNTITITRLSPRETFMELVTYAFKLDIADQALLRREFDTFSRVAALALSYDLAFPRDFTRLADVRAAIVDHLDAL